LVLSTFTVNSAADDGSAGTLRWAVEQSNKNAGADVIQFQLPANSTINVNSTLTVTDVLTIEGPGASALTVSGQGNTQILRFDDGRPTLFKSSIMNLTLSNGKLAILNNEDLSITGCVLENNVSGDPSGSSAILNTANASLFVDGCTIKNNNGVQGAGLNLAAGSKATIADSTFSGNQVSNLGGAVYVGLNAAFSASGSLFLNNSTGKDGGAIHSSGALTLTNCTLSANTAQLCGGGVYSSGATTITFCTFAHNLIQDFQDGDGSGVYNEGTLTINNSVSANNSPETFEIFSTRFNPEGSHNFLASDPDSGTNVSNLTNTLSGDPFLSPLGNYLGPTMTMLPLVGSPLIDAGSAIAGMNTDQRDLQRPLGGAPDIGAVEIAYTITPTSGMNQVGIIGPFANPLVVTVTDNLGNPALAGGAVTFSAPTTGPSVTNLGSPVKVGANGQASATASPNLVAGDFELTVSANGASPIGFPLKNAYSSTFSVTSASDDGSANTLRWAINQANTAGGFNLIAVAPSLQVQLAQGVLNITSHMAIQTTDGTGNFYILGNNQSQLVNVTSYLSLSSAALTGGLNATGAGGGAIQNSGTLILNNSQLLQNSVSLTTGNGGAIYNTGTMSLNSCVLVQNYANQGGAIYNAGTATLVNCTLGVDPSTDPNNFNTAVGNGGAIYNAANATLTLDGCAVENNASNGGEGGGIFSAGGANLTIRNSFIKYNRAQRNGGGVANGGPFGVSGSSISNNSAGLDGGAIWTTAGMLMTSSTLDGNSSSVSGGALSIADGSGDSTVNSCTFSNNTASQFGGAIRVGQSTLTLEGSTFLSNHAGQHGGGVMNYGFMTVTNCTFFQNTASDGGGFANTSLNNADGNYWLNLTFNNCTFSENSSGIYAEGGSIPTLNNTIVFKNGSFLFGSDNFIRLSGYDLGTPGINLGNFQGANNLVSDGDWTTSMSKTIVGLALLGTLQDNGGPTWTMALLPGSPAIDAGTAIRGIWTDQRGVGRPQGSAFDIGAFESQGFQTSVASGGVSAAAATPSPHPVAPVGKPFSSDLIVQVTSAYGEPVAGGIVRFVAATSGASAVLENGGSAVIDANGLARIAATANRVPGTHTIVTQTNGANSVAFTRTNIMPNFHGVWRGLNTTRVGRHRALLAQLKLANPGTVTTRGAGVTLYVSNDGVWDAGDKLVRARRSARLRPNGQQLVRWTLGPRQLRSGQYLIAVLDAKHSVDGSGPKRLFHAIASAPSA
jgi:predicted outer membrane repeat protein